MSTDASGSGERVVVGRIGRPHGIHGDVFVLPLTDVPELRFADGRDLHAGPPANRTLTIGTSKDHSGKLVVSFVGVDDRNSAELLRNAILEADVDASEGTGDSEEYFDRQLEGLRALDPVGDHIGRVTDVVHLPAQDLLEVTLSDGTQRLVPFVKQLVPTVDLVAGTIVIDAPDGLLTDEDDPDADEMQG